MLPRNRVLTSSVLMFQTSREHVLVARTVCAWRALCMYLARIVAIFFLLLQGRTKSNNYHYHYRGRPDADEWRRVHDAELRRHVMELLT
jgi:hypothetical protein